MSIVAWAFTTNGGPMFVWGERNMPLHDAIEHGYVQPSQAFPLHDCPLFEGQLPFAWRLSSDSGYFAVPNPQDYDRAHVEIPLYADFPAWPKSEDTSAAPGSPAARFAYIMAELEKRVPDPEPTNARTPEERYLRMLDRIFGGPNCLVICHDLDGNEQRFTGDTLLQALEAAVIQRNSVMI